MLLKSLSPIFPLMSMNIRSRYVPLSRVFEAVPDSSARHQELFSSTVGPLREVNLHYDHKGVSKGVAAVTFNRKGDGNKAFTQYNNRLIDGS